MAVIELRGACGLSMGKLDTDLDLVEVVCRACSHRADAPFYHWFDARTGEPLTPGEMARRAGERGAVPEQEGDRPG